MAFMDDYRPDRLVLGHNQFFGVNHLSSARGAATEQYFSRIDNVIEVIRHAYHAGVTGLMLSTHERARDIAEALRKDKELSEGLHLHILLPYMAKYVRMANENGPIAMLEQTLKQASWAERFSIGLKTGLGVVRKDLLSIIESLMRIELLPFKGLQVKSVFLHNALTDMIAALRAEEVVHCFMKNIEQDQKACPAFCTLSSGILMRYLAEIGVANPLIMAPFNPSGFQMNPSRQECEQVLADKPCRLIAMSVLAAGHVKPNAAIAYLNTLPRLSSVVFGASSKGHIDQMVAECRELVIR